MTIISKFSQLDLDKTYSYADYLLWKFNERVEIIKGKVMLMSPAPNFKHQEISRNLLVIVGSYLHKKKCTVFHAPFDVKLYDRHKSKLKNKDAITTTSSDTIYKREDDLDSIRKSQLTAINSSI